MSIKISKPEQQGDDQIMVDQILKYKIFCACGGLPKNPAKNIQFRSLNSKGLIR